MSLDKLIDEFDAKLQFLLEVLVRPETYAQIVAILIAYLMAYLIAGRVRKFFPRLQAPPPISSENPLNDLAYRSGKLLFPVISIVLLRTALEVSEFVLESNWIMQLGFAIALLLFFYSFVSVLIKNSFVASVFRWVGIPILLFYVAGVLGDIVAILESISLSIGNIDLSAYGVLRALIFGSLLFWLGRISNTTGQTIIRKQQSLDFRTREIVAKLFEIALFVVFILLLLQLLGINLTALAVFGGAVGVGLGFGLQSIASNFISGIIIIFDRSLSVGDYIELDDGRAGTVTKLNMRSTTLETFDGKDIVVPNEMFITTSFTNWTHQNNKQRYRVDFSVAYKTDVRHLVELVKEAVATHPQVLSGPELPFEERPDCEIDSFGDNGINMFVEFWIEGIDDGKNRVGGDLLLIILETLQGNGIEIPFPQRDLRIYPPTQAVQNPND